MFKLNGELAKRAEATKVVLELTLLVLATLYGAFFILRTWSYPSAQLEMASDIPGRLHLTFTVGDSANIRVSDITTECRPDCTVHCGGLKNSLMSGTLAIGDKISWDCSVATAEEEECSRVMVQIRGSASPSYAGSKWTSSAMVCRRSP